MQCWLEKSRNSNRRRFLSNGLCALIGFASLQTTFAQAPAGDRFPAQPVTVVVPFPAGGSTDYAARAVAQSLADTWKVPVVVENKVGAGGNIGADFVARSPANGQTILLGAVSAVVNPPLYKIAPYLPQQLASIGVGVATPLVTVVRKDLPASDIPALLALSRSRPDGLNAASAGAGTLSHLGLELLQADHKGNLRHIPYKGSAPALTDLMGGQVDVLIDTVVSASAAIAAGKVRAIAVHTPSRLPALPSVATYDEQGVKGMTFSAWNIFMVPAATPADRIVILNAAMSKAIRDPSMVRSLSARGFELIVQSPSESMETIRSESQRWEKVIKDRNVTL